MDIPTKQKHASGAVLCALIASRWVYTDAAGKRSIVTDAQKNTHMAKHDGDAERFKHYDFGAGRKTNSGMIDLIAERCDEYASTISSMCSGDSPISTARLKTLTETLKLTMEERQDLYLTALFGGKNHKPKKPEALVPALDSKAYHKANLTQLLRRVMGNLCIHASGERPRTIEELQTAIKDGRIVITTRHAAMGEAAQNLESLLRYDGTTASLGKQAEEAVARARSNGKGGELLQRTLSLLPLPNNSIIALIAKSGMLNNAVVGPKPVSPDVIFSPEHLFADGVPLHQGEILQQVRLAVAVKKGGGAQFWHSLFADALAQEKPELLIGYAACGLKEMGKMVGLSDERIRQYENGFTNTGHNANLTQHFDALAKTLSLSPEQMHIWRHAPHASDVQGKTTPQRWQKQPEDTIISLEQYRGLVEARQKPTPQESAYRDASLILGGLKGLRAYVANGPEASAARNQ